MKTRIFNPFIHIAGMQAFLFGLIIAVLSMALGFIFNARFDGVIDLHYNEAVSIQEVIFDQLNILISVTLCFFIAGKIFAKNNVRLIDILGTSAFARFPFLVLPLFNINQKMWLISEKMIQSMLTNPESIGLETADIVFLIISSFVSLLAIIWYITLLFNAYKVSTNLKSGKLIGSFIGALLLAEIISKINVYLF